MKLIGGGGDPLNRQVMSAKAIAEAGSEVLFTADSAVDTVKVSFGEGDKKEEKTLFIITHCNVGDKKNRSVYAGKILALLAPEASNGSEAVEYINNENIGGAQLTIKRQTRVDGSVYWTITDADAIRVKAPTA